MKREIKFRGYNGTGFPEDIHYKIYCGINERLFLALVALIDDTDRHQWFCDGDMWEKCEDDFPSKYMQMHGHKASVEELMEHFQAK